MILIYKSIFDVRKLNERMKPEKCEVTRVVDGENLEDFIWPSKVVSSSFVDSSFSKNSGNVTVNTRVQGNNNIFLGGNIVKGNLTFNAPGQRSFFQ